MKVDDFKNELCNLSSRDFAEKYLINSDPGVAINSCDLDYLVQKFKKSFALKSDDRVCAYVVGSAKFGFSFLDKKVNGIFKPAYRSYVPGVSDLDIALVSPKIYHMLWRDFSNNCIFSYPEIPEIKDPMFHGWIRPDKFPNIRCLTLPAFRSALNQVRSSDSFRDKNLRVGLYFSENFLVNYQSVGLDKAKGKL
ncbi:hypothetical protein ACSLNH_02165 [Comamonas kerstersii]|uniref:hypothetical protein n=1 Tax=Comamonas kerstersii TaxID=225992 RepID=UPI003EE2B0D9